MILQLSHGLVYPDLLALAVDGFKEKVNLMGDLKAVKATFQFVNPSQKKTSRVGFLPRVKLPWQSQGLTQPAPQHQTGITTHQLTYYIGQTIEESLRKITNWPFMKLRPNQRLLEKYTLCPPNPNHGYWMTCPCNSVLVNKLSYQSFGSSL